MCLSNSFWLCLIHVSFSAVLLGISVCYADQYQDPEIIPIARVDSPLALIPIYSQRIQTKLWATVSFDHVRSSITQHILLIHHNRQAVNQTIYLEMMMTQKSMKQSVPLFIRLVEAHSLTAAIWFLLLLLSLR